MTIVFKSANTDVEQANYCDVSDGGVAVEAAESTAPVAAAAAVVLAQMSTGSEDSVKRRRRD